VGGSNSRAARPTSDDITSVCRLFVSGGWAQWDLCFDLCLFSVSVKPQKRKEEGKNTLLIYFFPCISPSLSPPLSLSLCVHLFSGPRRGRGRRRCTSLWDCVEPSGRRKESGVRKWLFFLRRTGIGLAARGSSPRGGNNAVASRPALTLAASHGNTGPETPLPWLRGIRPRAGREREEEGRERGERERRKRKRI